MSRFTLYLCLLVGLIAVVTAASLEYNDYEVHPNEPSESCLDLVNLRCRGIQDKPARQACIAEWVKKLCPGSQGFSELLV